MPHSIIAVPVALAPPQTRVLARAQLGPATDCSYNACFSSRITRCEDAGGLALGTRGRPRAYNEIQCAQLGSGVGGQAADQHRIADRQFGDQQWRAVR
jgi:hypothetical protein